jgi:hypothetical protein
MKIFRTRPQLLTIKQSENGRQQFKPSIALEMIHGAQSFMSFAADNPLNIGSTEVEVMADIVPIHIPAHLRWVSDPLNENDKGYETDKFVKLTRDDTDRPLSTSLLHGIAKVNAQEKQQLLEKMAAAHSNHPCEMLASSTDTSAGIDSTAGVASTTKATTFLKGGDNCSIKVQGKGLAPVTLYSNVSLQLKIPVVKQNEVIRYIDRLDHFFIPTIMETGAIVWMAIERQEDPVANSKELARWSSDNFSVAGFSTLTVETDELGMRVAFDGRPFKG